MAKIQLITQQHIGGLIRLIRGRKVLLDEDLASLYGVETRILNRAVKRNLERFPRDAMLQITMEEYRNLISQIGISSSDAIGRHGGRRKPPLAFTELGVAMLSSVLNSPRAIAVNLEIMRTFIELRRIIQSNVAIAKKIATIEKRLDTHDKTFKTIGAAFEDLLGTKKKKEPVGFKIPKKLDPIKTG